MTWFTGVDTGTQEGYRDQSLELFENPSSWRLHSNLLSPHQLAVLQQIGRKPEPTQLRPGPTAVQEIHELRWRDTTSLSAAMFWRGPLVLTRLLSSS